VNGLREKIGQLFMVGIEGETLGSHERLPLEEYDFGGVILFDRNCREPRRILSLCRDLWNTAAGMPPFIAIDQEGGRVHRLPYPFTHFPPAARLGATGDTRLAYEAGHAAAAELALAGINLNFAPVLDVDSNPQNPVIADRAFGTTSQRVIEMSSAWARGSREGGIIPCGKHFPGHGGTDKDSHVDLPLVAKPLDQLSSVELPPFAAACKHRLEALMTAHVLYPALDPDLPATLSEKIVAGLLRHQLGYDGVVFSDDMEMKAISDRYDHAEAALLAARSGIDVLLFCHGMSKAIEVFEFLSDEAEKDPALRDRIESSYRRIGDLKRRYLKEFTGAADGALESRLRQMDHRRIVEEIHGSL
jgi:beta-N-acetylhexosaminidase